MSDGIATNVEGSGGRIVVEMDTFTPTRQDVRRVALSSLLGSTIEYYDFLLYGSAAALVFNSVYFPNLGPTWGTIASFASFAAGYICRFLGGVLFAHWGDRLGRKSVLIITMIMMGVATGLIGVLPSYAQIGVAAPALLLVLRLVQGLAAGGEYGGAAVMAAEFAPPKHRSLVTSSAVVGGPIGGLLAIGAFTLASLLPKADFMAWGWRMPFLIGFVIVAIGLYIRLKVQESPVFQRAAREDKTANRVPFIFVLRHHPLNVLRGTLASLANPTISALFGTYLVTYEVKIGYSATDALLGVIIGAAGAAITQPLFAMLSDRLGRRPVAVSGALLSAALAFPAFALINTHSTVNMFLAQALVIGIGSPSISSPLATMLAEMFPTNVRITGVSFCYQLAAALAGGFTPLLAAAVVAVSSGPTPSAGLSWLFLGICLVTGTALLLTRETRKVDLNSTPTH